MKQIKDNTTSRRIQALKGLSEVVAVDVLRTNWIQRQGLG